MKNSLSFTITFTILLISSVNIYPQRNDSTTIIIIDSPGNISSERPGQSQSPVTLKKNFFQAELGFAMQSSELTFTTFYDPMHFVTSKTRSYSVPVILLRYGITDNIELRLGSEYKITHYSDNYYGPEVTGSSAKFSPVEAGAKFNLVNESGITPETAFIVNLIIPTRYFNNADAELRFAFQNTLSDRFLLSYNLGAEWEGGDMKISGVFYTASLNISLHKKLSMFIEPYGFYHTGQYADNRLDGGFKYLITKNIQADISGGIGLLTYSPDYFIGAGLSFRLPR